MYRWHSPKGWDGPSWLVGSRAEVLGKEAFVAEVRSPTVRRRELGVLLRGLRNEKGLTVEQVANGLMCSPSKVSRMETGHGAVTPRDIRDLCNFYDVTDQAERDQLMSLARAGKQAGWWQGYDLDYFATYVGLETEATGIRYFQSMIVPGLMQTPAYARAMHAAEIPEFTAERIDQLIEVRLTRQRLLERKPPVRVEVILDEAVLHRLVGGAAVMREQLDRLIELASKPHISMQVIPYSAGAHPAMDSTFNILEFSSPVASVVYVEGLVGWIYVERPTDVERYARVFEHLLTVASSPRKSIELITRVGAGYNNPAALSCPGDNWA